MNTHDTVNLIENQKRADNAEKELRAMADKDFRSFCNNLKEVGRIEGLKIGLWMGALITLGIVLIIKEITLLF